VIVVDASVALTALVDDGPDGHRFRERLRDGPTAAPELLDVEVVSAIRRRLAAGLIDPRGASAAVSDLEDLAVERMTHRGLMSRCWELRDKLTPYDALYVGLAEHLDAVLLTTDARLARSPGPRCRIDLLT
jgi:predicted nucleic acid-binding protein